jgi:uncharacterized membrane protein YbhN (UPF0104 family)
MRWRALAKRATGLSRRIPPRVLRCALAAATAGVVVLAARGMSSSMPSAREIRHPDAIWICAALLAELGALVAYALIVRAVLAVWLLSGRTVALLRATLGGIAIGASLPAGQAVSLAFWYRQLRREGAEPRLAAFALAAAGGAGLISLTVLLVAGVALAGDAGPLSAGRVPILAAGGALLVLRIVLWRPLGRLLRKALRRFSLEIPAGAAVGRRGVAIAVCAYLNWLLDLGCLAASLAAMHASVPFQSVLLTYALAQIVANVPLLPGGGGTVEISLILGFAAFGRTSGHIVGGVLLFRLISCWGLVPIGWLVVALDRLRLRRELGSTGRELTQAVELDRAHALARQAELCGDGIRRAGEAVAQAVP